MAERNPRRRATSGGGGGGRLSRNSSVESTLDENAMAKSSTKEKRLKKPKERFLLTRKTWRYMADAGRKLIPDGVYNRQEDIPKIEAYFQEVCKKEPHFLLWRKNSYPGALGFRARKGKSRRKGGSCRKAASADEIEQLKPPERPKDLAIHSISGGRFDINKLKYDFLMGKSSSPSSPSKPSPESFASAKFAENAEEVVESQLIDMLEKYLTLSPDKSDRSTDSSTSKTPDASDLNYQELIDKLESYLTTIGASPSAPFRQSHYSSGNNNNNNSSMPYLLRKQQNLQVHFEGDYVQKSLVETLSRYFSRYPNRDKVISDLLTDRKTLEKLYFELRQAKGFRTSRTSTYSMTGQSNLWGRDKLSWGDSFKKTNDSFVAPPPLIEVQGESSTEQPTYEDWGIQTDVIAEDQLTQIAEEYKKILAERESEEGGGLGVGHKSHRRRSSVDNDDVSQSVSDTIKRYLRMARKKSVDGKQGDRFKRVNYDRNLRNIKAKGEITKPGDDDGLNKGCQTEEDWIVTFKNSLLFDSSPDQKLVSPTGTFQSFFTNLLHGGKSPDKASSGSTATTAAAGMQKSKSSSSVMHQGGRLVAKKIFRSRSKSQTRAAPTHSTWTPQGKCVWMNGSGKQVALTDSSLLRLSEVERKVLQKVALAKLQAINLGVAIKVPAESLSSTTESQKTKRRPYLLKRKALTTSIFDAKGEKDKENQANPGGLVFGIPLSQCVDNDRLSRGSSGTVNPLHPRDSLDGSNLARKHGSRASFSSLIDAHHDEEIGSCEDLLSRNILSIGSVPGHLNKLSCDTTPEFMTRPSYYEDNPAIPNILSECLKHLESNGLHTVGIFRVSSSKKRVRQLREDFDCGKETSLGDDLCPHDVATLIKEYLRDLPDPLLCRSLYQAFIQTQKIRNRRLQLEAIEYLTQLLPPANRDTLYALLSFLSTVASNSESQTSTDGLCLQGNKMDSNNLATVFAPNILHFNKPNSKDSTERPEDHLDVINVVRILIDQNKMLFNVPAELLDEVYVHMMDSHPEALDHLLNKRFGATPDDYGEDFDSESNSAPLTPTTRTAHMSIEHVIQTDSDSCNTPPERKKTWSREEFLHESAATGGPNVSMRFRHKDRIRERAMRKRREESTSRKKRDDENNNGSHAGVAMTIISKLRGQKDEDSSIMGKMRSASLDSNSSFLGDTSDRFLRKDVAPSQGASDRRKSSPYISDENGVITASLTIPVQTSSQPLSLNVDHTDIPYIEDNGAYYYIADEDQMPRRPEVPRRRHRSTSGSDSSTFSTVQPITGSLSIVQGYDSAIGSTATISSYHHNTPSVSGSSIADAASPPSWASTPPTSPDSVHTTANYIPDDQIKRTSILKSSTKTNENPSSQKVTYSNTPEIQQIGVSSRKMSDTPTQQLQTTRRQSTSSPFEVQKATSSPALRNLFDKQQRSSTSISSIGNDVLRSRTANFEKISKTDAVAAKTPKASISEKKKYVKRRYTDSKHPTRHIPDSESLEAHGAGSSTSATGGGKDDTSSQAGPVYKRRELISSVPSK